MKKSIILITLISLLVLGCNKNNDTVSYGSIYGIVTDKTTGDCITAAGVELMPKGLKTVTGSDGAFQFTQIDPGDYNLLVKKTGYKDLKSSTITVKPGEQAPGSVQIEKLPASLQILDNDGNPVTELDFGGDVGIVSKTFKIYNKGTESFRFDIIKDVDWIESITPHNNTVPVNGNCPVVVKIDRSKLADGQNTTSIIITSPTVGSVDLLIKAKNGVSGGNCKIVFELFDSYGDGWNGNAHLDFSDEVSTYSLTVVDGSNASYSYEYARGTNISVSYIKGSYDHENSYKIRYEDNTIIYECSNNIPSGFQVSFIVDCNDPFGGNTKPTVITTQPSNITNISAICGGNVTSDGGANVIARGICWSTSSNPTINDNHTTDGTGTGVFTSNIMGLSESTKYYVRAYATNSKGTAYGEQKNFTTTSGGGNNTVPTVTTTTPSYVTENSATCGGNVTSDGGATVTQRGICYSKYQNPTISDLIIQSGSGTGSFTCNLTGLENNTTYYVRAYATNSEGTAYGTNKNFTTTGGSINTDVTIILTAGDIWGDGTGYQMLLDNTHSLYGTIIPEEGALSMYCSGNESIYNMFSHKIPLYADGNCSTSNIVLNNSITLTIPAGIYDWCITNPTPGDRIWIASSQGNVGGRQDNYEFEAGNTYEFIVTMQGQNDAVNVVITGGAKGKKSMSQSNIHCKRK